MVRPSRPNAADDLPELAPGLRVEPGRRLVEKEQVGVAHERACHRQPLALAARELADPGRRFLREADRRDDLRRLLAAPIEAAEQREDLEDRELLGKPGFLQRHAQPLAEVVVVMAPPPAQHLDVARGGGEQALQDFDRGRLARAVRAEQAEALAAADLEVEAVDRANRPGLRRIVLRERPAADRECGGRAGLHGVRFRSVRLRRRHPGPDIHGPGHSTSARVLRPGTAHTTVAPPCSSHPAQRRRASP